MTKMINVLLNQGATMTKVTLTVNGKSVTIPNNVKTAIPAEFEDAARNCAFDIQILGPTEAEDAPVDDTAVSEDDGAAGGGGGNAPTGDHERPPLGEPGHSDDHFVNRESENPAPEPYPMPEAAPADTFDAEAIINGKVDDVAARLAALTPEQLAKVAAAESDREQPRKGVLAAIEAAKPQA